MDSVSYGVDDKAENPPEGRIFLKQCEDMQVGEGKEEAKDNPEAANKESTELQGKRLIYGYNRAQD